MTDDARGWREPLGRTEVRVATLDTGDSAAVRGAARLLLAAQCDGDPDALEIRAGEKGKPYLVSPANLHFSISHAHGVSMIAITRVAAVGVDVEQIRAVPKAAQILERFFARDHIDTILSDDHRDLRFVEAWTRAEATVKVRGASVWEVATPDPSVTVRALSAPDGFAAAVAVAAHDWNVTQVTLSLAQLGITASS